MATTTSVQDTRSSPLERVVDGPGEKRGEELLVVVRVVRLVDAAQNLTRLPADLARLRAAPDLLMHGEVSHSVNKLFVSCKAQRAIHLRQFFHDHIYAFRTDVRGGIVVDHDDPSVSLPSLQGVVRSWLRWALTDPRSSG